MDSNDLGFDDDFMATMLGDFLDESQIYLTNLNDNLLVLDELVGSLGDDETPQVDLELLNEMFRDAHSLKGLSAMLQLDDINKLTHNVENVFDAARDQTLVISTDVVDLMFKAFDRLAGMVEHLKDPSAGEAEYESIVEGIKQLLQNAGVDREQGSNAEIDDVFAEKAEKQADDNMKTEQLQEKQPQEEQPEKEQAQKEQPQQEQADEPDPLAGVEDETEIPSKYLPIFIDETEESLDSLSEALLMEEEVAVDSLLIVCHRIKGAAASIGLHRSAKLAHLMEDLLQELRDTKQSITCEISDALLAAVDSLRSFVEKLKNGERGSDSFSQAYQVLHSVHLGQANSSVAETVAPVEEAETSGKQLASITSEERNQMVDVAPEGSQALAGLLVLEAGLPLAEIKAQIIFERLEEMGDLFHRDPEDQQLQDSQGVERLLFGIATDRTIGDVRRSLDMDGVEKIVLEDISSPAPDNLEQSPTEETVVEIPKTAPLPKATAPPKEKTPPVASPAASKKATPSSTEAAASKNKPTETLRVDIERLDHLMNLAGQLVINKARFGQIGENLKDLSSRKQSAQCLQNISGLFNRILGETDELVGASVGGASIAQGIHSHVQQIQRDLEVVQDDLAKLYHARTLVNDLFEAVHQLDRVSDGIQKSVMDIRMVPIGPLFGRFKRVIRDITRGNGKNIKLVIRGDKTELDKRMIDELGDPLIHMVRNSADHGIESPEDRLAAGKPEQGTVTLDAFHRGNRIIIQVRDDGKGLDPEKLRAKAVEKGIITAADAERLTPQQALQLIWEPGFSTAEKVTEVSGRGMGMDIVRSKIEQISGTLELDSQLGAGTTITIKLPLTMAILPSLLTIISDDVFAIPMESVSEIVSVGEKDLTTVHGMKTATIRGRAISVVELNELLHWDKGCQSKKNSSNEQTLVIVGSDENELGLAVDDLLGEEDIVIKSLAENYQNVLGIAGASILGDGRVSLILDVAALVDMACRKNASTGTATTTKQLLATEVCARKATGRPTGVPDLASEC
ncbi:MAG: hypothetical protein GXP26_08440 [Planctomycetes bacterium]|nr:hypothetical protein [Planctomycetota bacterium]